MLNDSQLDERLRYWTQQYGWGGMPGGSRGKNLLQKLIDHAGFVPERLNPPGINNQTWGDEIEQRVKELQSAPPDPADPNKWYRMAMVLRVTYLGAPYWSPDECLERLRGVGVQVSSRTTYYKLLGLGRTYLASVINARATA